MGLKAESGEHTKPRSQFIDEAVQAAISGRWEEAADLNRTMIERFGADEESQNRLGKALSELGKLKEARTAYQASLALNPMNPIARKNIGKLEVLLQSHEDLRHGPAKVDLNLFVEEMGKTVTTALEDVSDPDIATKVAAGDVAELRVDGAAVVVELQRGYRLGVLEPKLARRLIKFIQGGNRYQAGVIGVDGTQIRIIVRETYQDPKFAGKPSFPKGRQKPMDFRPYAKESLIPRDLEIFGDDDEDEARLAPESARDEEYDGLSVEDESDDVDFVDEPDVAVADDDDDDDEDEDEE